MRSVWQKVKGEWKIVKYGCMTCEATYTSLVPYEKHIKKCRINTLKRKQREEKDMPIQAIMKNGKRMYRWGDSGKLYEKREDAEQQARAAYSSGYREKSSDASKKKVGSDGKVCWEGYRYGGTNPDGSDKCIKVKR